MIWLDSLVGWLVDWLVWWVVSLIEVDRNICSKNGSYGVRLTFSRHDVTRSDVEPPKRGLVGAYYWWQNGEVVGSLDSFPHFFLFNGYRHFSKSARPAELTRGRKGFFLSFQKEKEQIDIRAVKVERAEQVSGCQTGGLKLKMYACGLFYGADFLPLRNAWREKDKRSRVAGRFGRSAKAERT